MSTVRQTAAGATRTCPHCRAQILESAAVCPACRHHLRFDPGSAGSGTQLRAPSFTPLRVEGAIRHPEAGEAWEYSVLVQVRNEKGEEIARQVVGVGALQPSEQRTFSLTVEVFTGGQTGRRADGQ
jgi:hypothetical protein